MKGKQIGMINPIKYDGKKIMLLDQTLLPTQSVYEHIKTVDQMFDAIQTMKVRGARAIGIAAAYGMLIAAKTAPTCSCGAFMAVLTKHGEYLASSRPTEVNLTCVISRMLGKAERMHGDGIREIVAALETKRSLSNKKTSRAARSGSAS